MERPLIIIVGSTGVGKSVHAMAIAKERSGEVINADSQQVYRGCDIGTGKVPAALRQEIPHHCLDLVDPDQSFDVAQYVAAADAAIAEVSARGKQPIICGGTGLYLTALVYGLAPLPPADRVLRAELAALMGHEGSGALHRRLAEVDPEAAAQINPRHTSRLIRALEVKRLTGRSITEWHSAHRFGTPRYRADWTCLMRPREELYERIDRRVETMLNAGWLEEVRTMLSRYGPVIAPLRAIGYRELVRHLKGERDLPATIALIKQNTRRYAKRQLTWFRRMPDIQWIQA
ncbi:MAG: tRNA (adenosine(37)-N6)-dimethylallyltransferase MiaA [Deltaproteobacteria bacterium]|nr:tRNA (adenosine(37)-N6)-dimethylallyltransferase MiaA [Deltaproteobacteria bacterium]